MIRDKIPTAWIYSLTFGRRCIKYGNLTPIAFFRQILSDLNRSRTDLPCEFSILIDPFSSSNIGSLNID